MAGDIYGNTRLYVQNEAAAGSHKLLELVGIGDSQGTKMLGSRVSALILHEKCLLVKWSLTKTEVWVGFEVGG